MTAAVLAPCVSVRDEGASTEKMPLEDWAAARPVVMDGEGPGG